MKNAREPRRKNLRGFCFVKEKEFWNTIQVIFAAVGGWLGYFLGGCDGLCKSAITQTQ